MRFKNVLLIQPMHEKAERRPRESINFPWGLAYIATYLRREGCSVEILDGQALQLPKEELAPRVDSAKYDLIGITGLSTQFNAVRHLAEHIKDSTDVPVVVGGPLATYQPKLVLEKTRADVCVMGEGEITVVDLVRRYNNLPEVKGIAYRVGKEVRLNIPQDRFVHMDELPVPDFELFDMERYFRQGNAFARRGSLGRSISFISSRGCPYSCNFCSKSSRSYRIMSPQRVNETLLFLKSELGIEEVAFGDELFLASKKWFRELAPLLKSLGLPWGGQARVNLVDEELLATAKNAGCVGIGYGIESGSQKILDNMNKRITVEQIEHAMRHTMKLKIPVKVQLIFGYPGEDESTVQETIDLFKKIEHPGRRFNVITPLPGSQLYDYSLQKGMIKDEVTYLCNIEKSFGWGKVHINFTNWPDDEIYPRKRAAEEQMRLNYFNKSVWRRARHALGALKRRLVI